MTNVITNASLVVLALFISIVILRSIFFRVARIFTSVTTYFANHAVREAPVMVPAASLTGSVANRLPARYTSKFYNAVDYSKYDSPTYVRKAESELAAQRAAALKRTNRN